MAVTFNHSLSLVCGRGSDCGVPVPMDTGLGQSRFTRHVALGGRHGGLTLQRSDFTNVWATRTNRAAIPLGIACQFGIMPLSALLVGQTLLLGGSAGTGAAAMSSVHQALFVGLCLVGCAPGGTASNLVTLIANANVALSVILTTCSTLAAVILTPLLVKLLAGTVMTNSATAIQISGWALCAATAKVVVLPILAGMCFKAKAPRLADTVSRYTPLASVLLVSLICGGVVAQTAPLLTTASSSSSALVAGRGAIPAVAVATKGAFSGLGTCLIALGLMSPAPLIPLLALPFAWRPGVAIATRATCAAAPIGLSTIVTSVLMLHMLGFGVGYLIPKLRIRKRRHGPFPSRSVCRIRLWPSIWLVPFLACIQRRPCPEPFPRRSTRVSEVYWRRSGDCFPPRTSRRHATTMKNTGMDQ
jgi:predicted Na+-dependent transporter